MSLLVAVHFWRIRKDGGLSRPPEEDEFVPGGLTLATAEAASAPNGAARVNAAAQAQVTEPASDRRRYGIQGLVRGPITKAGNIADRSVFSWPNLFMAELVVFLVTVAGVLLVSLFFNAPMEEPVNIMHPPNPAKAPWYFLGLQEMVSYSAFWGGVGVPTIEVLLLLFLPYVDRKPGGVGRWFSRERLLANSLFLTFAILNIALIIIGTFFRGPNWEFVSPW